MSSARSRYRQEYTRLVEERKTLAYRSMGFLSAIVQMNNIEISGTTFEKMRELVNEYNKLNEEILHTESLLDLIDYDDSEDDSEWL